MQHAAEAFDERVGELAFKKGGKVGALRPAGADRAAQRAGRAFGERFDLARLGLDVASATSTSICSAAVDAAAKRLGLIALEREVLIERRDSPASQG